MSERILLNPIECQRRLRRWLAENFEEQEIEMLYDDAAEDAADKLHFIVTVSLPDGGTVSPTPTNSARSAMQSELGPAFWFVHRPAQLDVYALQPTVSDAARLRSVFERNAQLLAKPVWPVWFASVALLASFAFLCFVFSLLHEHWHRWDSPWETLFHHVFTVLIYFGDRMRSIWAPTSAEEGTDTTTI